MSSIHRAFDTATGRWIALKLLKAGGLTRRFLREGTVLAELRHDAIVEYVAHGVSGTGDAWLAMEWLEGETLHAHLKRRELTIPEALALASRLAGALACAHARAVVHRDVKPLNIFLPQGDPALAKLLDFGVAHVDNLGGSTLTGELVGTMAFMAPEQARGQRDVDARADMEHISRDALLVLMYGKDSALDQAALAVRCGLAIRGALPNVAVAVAMGARYEGRGRRSHRERGAARDRYDSLSPLQVTK